MNPTIQIPQLPPLKPDNTFDTPALQRFLEDVQKVLRDKQLADYQSYKMLDESKNDVILKIYPINSIYLSVSSTNPGTYLGGTWVPFGTGKTLVGIDPSQTEFDTIEKTGGAKTHTLTVAELAPHDHTVNQSNTSGSVYGWGVNGKSWGGGYWAQTSVTGSGVAHNNLQPYITVYMWKRTS